MTTNVPQDVIDDTIEAYKRVTGATELQLAAPVYEIANVLCQLRDQRAGGEAVASPDGEDYLRLSKSGYTLRVGWGDSMRFVAASPKPLHELSSEQQKQWLDDAERLCDGWNRATPPQANNATEHPCDLLVAAAYRNAAEICDKQAELDRAAHEAPAGSITCGSPYHEGAADAADECMFKILAAIPADAEAALKEYVRGRCVDVASQLPIMASKKEIEAIVNSVLEGGK